MKPFERDIPTVNEAEIRQIIAKRRKTIGQLTPQRGQQVWSFNINTSVVKIEEYQQRVVVTENGNVTEKYLDVDDGCLYCVAINKRNAMRKFINMLDELMGIKK